MSEPHHVQEVPRGALVGALVLIVTSLGLASSARSASLAATATAAPAPPPRESVDLRFVDQRDGSLSVVDAASGGEVTAVAPGANNFIRGVLRGMFRERKLEGIGHEGAFRLSREFDGRLALVDLTTRRRVDLDSFGPSNLASFEAVLVAARRAP